MWMPHSAYRSAAEHDLLACSRRVIHHVQPATRSGWSRLPDDFNLDIWILINEKKL